MDKSTHAIKVAKINAWQAVIVAVIGGIAGVTGTAGLKYYEYSKAMSEKENKIQEMERTLATYEQDFTNSPLSVLRVAKVGIEIPECLKRLSAWHKSESSKVAGSGGSQHSTSYDGYFISQFGGFTVRAACPSVGDKAVISVSFLYRTNERIGISRVIEVADNIMTILQ